MKYFISSNVLIALLCVVWICFSEELENFNLAECFENICGLKTGCILTRRKFLHTIVLLLKLIKLQLYKFLKICYRLYSSQDWNSFYFGSKQHLQLCIDFRPLGYILQGSSHQFYDNRSISITRNSYVEFHWL